MRKKAVIIDIDGTLANIGNSLHILAAEVTDYDEWMRATVKSPPNAWCVTLIDAMWAQGYEIVFVTGRNSKYKDATKKWLDRNINIRNYKLIMRPNEDFRPDDVVKEDLYNNEVKKSYDILFVVDDRKRVVDTWRRLGLTCLQCAEGNY